MGKTIIKVDCVDQRLYVSNGPVIASGGRNEDEILFNFCSLWDNFDKTAVFYRTADDVYHAPVEENRCVIPHEVLGYAGQMYFGVFGVNGEITRTSEIMTYRIHEGAITSDTKPSDPTPDIYARIVSDLAAITADVADHEARLASLETQTPLTPQEYELTGNPVQMQNYAGMPMNVVSVLVPGESPTAHTSASLTRCGKNLFPAPTKITRSGITLTPQPDGGVHIGGTLESGASLFLSTPITAVLSGEYTLSVGNADAIGDHLQLRLMSGGTSLMATNVNAAAANASKTFTLTDQAVSAWVIRVGPNVTYDVTIYPVLELGATATAFEPYKGETFVAEFGQSVYGGVIDWNTGLLTVTHDSTGAQLATPETIPLTGRRIAAAEGINSLYTNFGILTVSGRTDILGLASDLIERVENLEGQSDGLQPDGGLTPDAPSYILPTASETVKGGVMIGKGLKMDGDVLGVVPEGAYEVIETIALNGDVVIDRTEEPDGTPYNFTNMLVEYTLSSKSSEAGHIYTRLFSGDITLCSYGIGNAIAVNGTRWAAVGCNIVKGAAETFATDPGQSQTSLTALKRMPITYMTDGNITKLYANASVAYPEGSVMLIKGVRANA